MKMDIHSNTFNNINFYIKIYLILNNLTDTHAHECMQKREEIIISIHALTFIFS